MQIALVSPDALIAAAAEFSSLLRDAVEQGASIGFTWPLGETEIADYWRKVATEVAAGGKLLLAVRDETGRLAGSAQLALELRPNGRHRSEVQKVMVRTAMRGRRLGVDGPGRARGPGPRPLAAVSRHQRGRERCGQILRAPWLYPRWQHSRLRGRS